MKNRDFTVTHFGLVCVLSIGTEQTRSAKLLAPKEVRVCTHEEASKVLAATFEHVRTSIYGGG